MSTFNNNLFGRFKDADWFGQNQDILLVGLGGIGKGTAEQLCLLGHRLSIFEEDTIEEHNCIPQGYFLKDIGKKKADAFLEIIRNYGLDLPEINVGKYQEDSIAYPIMISCVDNMRCRKDMFNNWKNQEDRLVFIDGRMLAEYFEVFVVTPENQDQYEEYLFDDSEVPAENCTYKQTRFVSGIIHGIIAQLFNNWLSNYTLDMNARSVPFKTVYNGIFADITTN